MVLLFTEATTTPTTVPPDFDGMNENYVKDTIVICPERHNYRMS